MNNSDNMVMDAVRVLIKESGLAPSALAAKAKIAPSTLNRQIAGASETGFSHKTLTVIAKAAGYDSYEDFIVKWKNPEKNSNPQSNSFAQADSNWRQLDVAILDSLKIIMDALVGDRLPTRADLANVISIQETRYLKSSLKGAAPLMASLLEHVNAASRAKIAQKKKRPAPPVLVE